MQIKFILKYVFFFFGIFSITKLASGYFDLSADEKKLASILESEVSSGFDPIAQVFSYGWLLLLAYLIIFVSIFLVKSHVVHKALFHNANKYSTYQLLKKLPWFHLAKEAIFITVIGYATFTLIIDFLPQTVLSVLVDGYSSRQELGLNPLGQKNVTSGLFVILLLISVLVMLVNAYRLFVQWLNEQDGKEVVEVENWIDFTDSIRYVGFWSLLFVLGSQSISAYQKLYLPYEALSKGDINLAYYDYIGKIHVIQSGQEVYQNNYAAISINTDCSPVRTYALFPDGKILYFQEGIFVDAEHVRTCR